MVSIIIPTYNSADTIGNLIESILNSTLKEDIEIIVVDDCSSDETVEMLEQYPVKLIINEKNQGSAAARNAGVSHAMGDKIIFFDSDVVVKNDTLSLLIKSFKAVSEEGALIGIYSKLPQNKGFIAEFKALFDYSHWLEVKGNEVTSFEPRCAIIRKETFFEAGGFNEEIKGANVEDYEFGYRLIEKHPIFLDRSIQVSHRFPSTFIALAMNFYRRGFSWTGLFLKRREFDNVGTTKRAGLSCAFAFLSLFFLAAMPFFKESGCLFAVSLMLYFYFYKSFFKFVLYERGFLFTLKAFFLQYVLSLIVGAAVIKGIFFHILKGLHGKN